MKTELVGVLLTKDEKRKLNEYLLKRALEKGHKPSISLFLRELLEPILNGNPPKPISQESKQETKLPTTDVNPQKINMDFNDLEF